MTRPKTSRPTMTVLLVDDNELVRQTVREYLESFATVSIIEASDGQQALERIRGVQVDLIISDWEMPNINGLDFLREIRRNEDLKGIPFIMITSQQSNERIKVQTAASHEVDAYVIKPFTSDVLKEKIRLVTERRQSKDEKSEEPEAPPKKGALLVDDDPSARETIAEYLAHLGYNPVIQATDGEEGYELLKKNLDQIAVVISDWEMPKLAGIDLLRRMRTEKRELGSVPFVMITSQSSLEVLKVNLAIAAEVDHYLMKPFGVTDLQLKIDVVMKKAESERAIAARLRQGGKSLERLDAEEAMRIFRSVLHDRPKSVEARLGLAEAFLAADLNKYFEQALYYLKEAVKLSPRSSTPYLHLALAFEQARSMEKAVEFLREGIKQCSLDEELHCQLGRMLFRMGRLDDAITELETTLQMNPSHEEAKTLLGEVLKKWGAGA